MSMEKAMVANTMPAERNDRRKTSNTRKITAPAIEARTRRSWSWALMSSL